MMLVACHDAGGVPWCWWCAVSGQSMLCPSYDTAGAAMDVCREAVPEDGSLKNGDLTWTARTHARARTLCGWHVCG